jgi:hypothetical protein
MACSGMLGRVSEEISASFIWVTKIVELGKSLAVTSNRSTYDLEFLRSVLWLLVTASVVPSSQNLVTLINEELSSPRNVGSYKSHTS